MSKKKKRSKSTKDSINLLKEVDETLNGSYESLVQEIQEMQLRINLADAKAMEKQRKKLIRQQMGVIPYYTSKEKVKAREKVLKQMETTDMLGRLEISFKQLIPCVVIIARLIAALITTILSVEPIKRLINPNMMSKMDTVYKLAMSVH